MVQLEETLELLVVLFRWPNGLALGILGLFLSVLLSRSAYRSRRFVLLYCCLSVVLVLPIATLLWISLSGARLEDFFRSFEGLGFVIAVLGAWFGSFAIGWLVGWPLGFWLSHTGNQSGSVT